MDKDINMSHTEITQDVHLTNLPLDAAIEREAPTEHTAELQNAAHINLTWKSWIVVFVSCFAIMSQVFVVVAAGSVIAFIIRDLGNAPLAGWIIQGPLLMQAVLSPIIGRLSDVLDRKYIASIPPLLAFVGAAVSATAKSMTTLLGGGILIGTTLATIAIVQAIPAEVLPLRYRALANGFAFLAGAVGGIVGVLGAGGLTNSSPSGWRDIFWMQAAFHLATCIGLLAFYWPKKRSAPKLSIINIFWEIDPIGSGLFIVSAALLLLALDWTGSAYPWHDAHVAAPLGVGFGFLAVFCLYEWKGRSDGIVAHVFFKGSPNFALSCFAFAVEGWIFYSAVNSVTPQIVLHLGFADNSWTISLRQLAFNCTTLVASIPLILYSTKYKDLKSPLLVTFGLFLVVTICYGCITPTWNHAQIGLNVLAGIGQSGPLTLLVALIQFTAPHAYLSTATGLGFSARAIGGAFGSAVLDAIINSKLSNALPSHIASAALSAGLPKSSLPAFIEAIISGKGLTSVKGVSPNIIAAAQLASERTYAHAYNLAWWSILPFVVLALVAVACLHGVKELMTDRIEATVENVDTQVMKLAV